MSSTDDRIVRMQFDNKQFMKGASDTQKALADTNKAVDSAGKGKGLLDLSNQMNQVMVTASKMQVVTTTALATIANKVVNTGLNMAKALTFDPIKQGFTEYESLLTKQNVIMNATGMTAKQVKGYLNELNHYSDQTIYSFSDMTDSITKFVNAGVPMDKAVVSVRGIANAAAYAGATTGEAGRAMYAFSQSMQTGYIMLNDWMQIENANMGTMKFKNELLETAVAVGTLKRSGDGYVTATDKYVSATDGWRDGLSAGWATVEVLNKALGKYANTNTKLGKAAFESATQVRTFTAFMDTLKESLGSGWAAIFTALIGGLKQATSFWTGLSNAVGGGVSSFFDFLAVALKTWRKMGGFEKALGAIKNVLAPIGALLDVVGTAWRNAFPNSDKGAGGVLYAISSGLELITRPLSWLATGLPAITPILTFFFGAIRTGGTIIGNVIGFVKDFVESMITASDFKPSGGGFIAFMKEVAAAVGRALDKVNELLNKGSSLGAALGGAFSGLNIAMPDMPDMGGATKGASAAGDAAKDAASGMASAWNGLTSIAVKMGAAFSSMWDKAVEFFSGVTMDDVVMAFNQAIFATMAINVIRMFASLRKALKSFVDIGGGVAGILEGAGDALHSFQTQANAKLILNIGIALLMLAGALWILSKIPAKQLFQALGAMAVIVLLMNRAMGAFGDVIEKLDGKGTIGKSLALSVAMLALSASMIMLSTALLIMNKVKWSSLVKGLGSMIVMMKVLGSLGIMGRYAAKNLVAGAAAIAITAGAMILLAGALLLFKLVDWGSMGKAGATLGGLTLAVGALALIPYAGISKVGLALLGASAGIMMMANALLIFQLVKWESIGKAAVVLGLLTISLAVLMAVGGPASVAAMLGLAGAMVLLAGACIMLNSVDWESIGKAAVVLTVLLAALAVGAVIMTAFLYAIAPISPVLIILGAGFALLGVGLLAFSAAMAIAIGLAAAGTAAFAALATGAAVAIGVFLQTLALQAPIMRKSMLAILQEIINTIVEAVPMVIRGIKDLWNAIVRELGSENKKQSFGEIAQHWFDRFLGFIRKNSPKVISLLLDMALDALRALNNRAGQFAQVGVDFVVNLIQGISSRSGRIVDAAIDLIIKMAQGIRKNTKRLTDAGIDLIAGFLHDLASSIRSGSSKIGGGISDVVDAMRDVGVNMVKGLAAGVVEQGREALSAIGNLVQGMIDIAKKIPIIKSPSRVFMEIGKFMVKGLTKGIQTNATSAIVAVASMMTGAIAMADVMMSKYLQKLDQQAIAAQARAKGLAAAAEKATKSAKRTKDKGDDKAANRLSKEAKKAKAKAAKETREAKQAREADARRKRWEKADSAERAEIRSNQAQSQLAAAKDAERAAEAARVQSNALREQAGKAGSPQERKRLLREAARLRKEAREQAERANNLLNSARGNAGDALVWQKKAGEEAAKSFQEQFEKAAQEDADADAFEKLTDAEKAEKRRQQAEEMQALADQHLTRAKELAYTDLEAANKLAEQAMAEAEQARQFLEEAAGYSGGSTNEVISLQQSDAAALAFNDYAALYDAAYAAAAGGTNVEFNQYNTSPESLSDAEIYRQTNNQLTFAADRLAGAAA